MNSMVVSANAEVAQSAHTATAVRMFARRQRPHRHVEMRGRDRQVEDQVDIPVVDKGIDLCCPQVELGCTAPGGVCIDVRTGGDFDAAKQRRVAHIGERNAAASHNADPECLCH